MSEFLIGWERSEHKGFGFTAKASAETGEMIADDGDGHVMVMAGTGGGKTRSIAIPNLLYWDGPAIVLDIKGELTATTARYRREVLGQEVVVLDPWKRIGDFPDTLNPLSILLDDVSLADDCYMLASMFAPSTQLLSDPFWQERAEALVAGLIAHIVTDRESVDRSLGRLFDLLQADDVVFGLATLLDKQGATMSRFAYRQVAGFLQTADKTRESILSSAHSLCRILGGDLVKAATARTSFKLDAVTSGAPMTIYVVVPPEYLRSHAGLIRLWISVLLALLLRRRAAPEKPTLLLLDEVAQLGPLEQLQTVVTLSRSYGVRAALFLQSYSQLASTYPRDHRAIFENCGTFITMGLPMRSMASAVSEALGDLSPEALAGMRRDEAAVKTGYRETRIVRKLDYLTDEMFKGRFDANPMFARRAFSRSTGQSIQI